MSCFEDLPNELFICLFQYFDLAELYQSFFLLNSRFQHLIKTFSAYHLCLQSTFPLDLLPIFVPKIQSLHIKNYQYQISLALFANSLEKLVLECSIKHYLKEISLLVNLRYLDIRERSIYIKSYEPQIYVVATTKLQHVSALYVRFCSEFLQLSLLKSICLYQVDGERVFDKIIRHLPQLTHLEMYDYYYRGYPSNISNQNIIITYPMITNFRLHLPNGFTNTQLEWYFTHLSNTQRFHIDFSSSLVYYSWTGPYALLNIIANFLEKYLTNLRRFSCSANFEMRTDSSFDNQAVHSIYQRHHIEKSDNNIRLFKFFSCKNVLQQ